jgi:hypothetical protein
MTNQAQIEIRSRDVEKVGPLFGSQHLFIICKLSYFDKYQINEAFFMLLKIRKNL